MKDRKCGIIGLGNVGKAVAFSFATSGIFNEVVLSSRNEDQAWAEMQDLNHANALIKNKCVVSISSRDKLVECEIIVITIGVSQGLVPIFGRGLGVEQASEMITETMTELAPNNPDAVYIIITNPVEAMVWKAIQVSHLPANQVVSTGTLLDSSRLQNAIGHLYNLDPKDVDALVIGEHGATAFGLFDNITVNGVRITDIIGDDSEEILLLKSTIIDVLKEPLELAKYKNGTSSAVALTALKIAETVVTNSNSMLTVSTVPEHIAGLEDIALNLPCVIGKGGVKKVIMPTLKELEKIQLNKSIDVIRAKIDQIR